MSSLLSPKFPSPGGRLKSTPGINSDLKSSAKKKQSTLKSVTTSFVKLVCNWNEDVSQITTLLRNLESLQSVILSVRRVKSRTPRDFPLFDEVFTDGYPLLLGKLSSEAEYVLHQLKVFSKRMGDVIAAMTMVNDEASSSIRNESSDTFDSSIEGVEIVFNVDHVLDIQQLCSQYVMEYERKQSILRRLFADESNSGMESEIDTVSSVCDSWSDKSSGSLLDHQLVETFLAMNSGPSQPT
jgi:hypothetical protein